MNTTPFMDKQIMDLTHGSSSKDFIDLMKNEPSQQQRHRNHEHDDDDDDEEEEKLRGNGISKDDIVPSYDFQPIRPLAASNYDSAPNFGAAFSRLWNSDSNSNASPPITKMSEEDIAASENNSAKPRARPIVRIGIFIISHSNIVSVICFIAGVLALLLLPILAKNTYISENALMPGSANNMLSTHHVSDAYKFIKDLTDLEFRSRASPVESQKLIAHYMSALDAEVTFHKFYPQFNQFHPLHFFTSPSASKVSENATCSSFGINTVGIIRAPHGAGKEAIVLVTLYNPNKVGQGEALSLGIAYSVFLLPSRVTWLAKNIVWLVADSQYGEYSAVAAWLREYQAPVFQRVDIVNGETCNENHAFDELGQGLHLDGKLCGGFRRAGTMAAALVIKVAEQGIQYEDNLNIYAEASNGQMPNLDLINIVNYLAVHKQGLRIKVKKVWSLVESRWLNSLGVIFESFGKIARSINPQWKFGIPATEYVEGAATLTSSLYYQGLGIPTGPHGAFRDYQVDAITIEISPKVSPTQMIRCNDLILRGGRLIEGVIRSINNLLEKFHQSFFLYLLTSPTKFVSVGVYVIPFALLVAPLPIVAAYLHANANNSSPQTTSSLEVDTSHKSWKWFSSARKVLFIHLWGVVVSLLPLISEKGYMKNKKKIDEGL